MMAEISLSVLDVVENSIHANADFIQIKIEIDNSKDTMLITITDNGIGMTSEQIKQVEDPFFTTRTTRDVGLGIPFFKYSAECTGGTLSIRSELYHGTVVRAEYKLSHIDRMPLGDITSSIHALIIFHTNVTFIYSYIVDNKSFTLDTREFKSILGSISFSEPEVSAYIKKYLQENKDEVDGRRYI